MFLFGNGFKREWAFAVAIALIVTAFVVPLHARAHDFGGVSTSEKEDTPDKEEPKCQRSTTPCGCEPPPASGGGFNGGEGGDPIWFYDGRMMLTQTDMSVGVNYPIALTRRYKSTTSFDSALGYAWTFEHDRRLFEYPDGSLLLRTGCGRKNRFVPAGGGFATSVDGVQGTLTQLASGTYVFALANSERNYFDADGRLTAIENRAGQRHEFTYDARGSLPLIGTSKRSVDPTQPLVVAYQPRLTRIAERSVDGQLTGAYVDFFYQETSGRLTHVIASDGRRIDYSHDPIHGNLTAVSGLQNYSQTFGYTDPNNPHLLTSYVSGAGAEPAVNSYDSEGRVTMQTIGNQVMSISYPTATTRQVTWIVKDPSGATLYTRVHSYQFEGQYLVKETNALGHELRRFYTPNRDLEREEIWQKPTSGALNLLKTTNWTYDGQGRQLTESVTLDSGEVVTTTQAYDHGWVASVESISSFSSQIFHTEYTFYRDGNGVPARIHEVKRRRDDGVFAITTYAYCSTADTENAAAQCPYEGLVKSIDGPRTDVADVTSHSYYTTTELDGCASALEPCHRKGDLKRVTNAVGQYIEVLVYDAFGRAMRVRGPSGVVVETLYSPRGWPLSRAILGADPASTADDAVTTLAYDARGNITSRTDADGVVTRFVYDARDHLIEVHDATGGRLTKTFDSSGSQLDEEVWDSANILKRRRSFSYDKLGRLIAEKDAYNRVTAFEYDAIDRQIAVIDALGHRTEHTYDDLNRLVKTVVDASLGGIQSSSQLTYDAVGNLRALVDPKGLATNYVYDSLGRLTQLGSPDSGTTNFTYDLAGNLLTQTDANNTTLVNSYDALNRIASTSFADSTYDVTYVYDQPDSATGCEGSQGLGHLTRVTDSTGSAVYCYDRFGNIARKTHTASDAATSVGYAYSLANRLLKITYPSGAEIAYVHDVQGHIISINRIDGSQVSPIVTAASYLPFGPLTGVNFSGGAMQTWAYDQNYRIDSVNGTALSFDYTTDSVGNISSLSDPNGAEIRVYGYDALSRLGSVKDGNNNLLESFTYDGTGNRLSKQTGSINQEYEYLTGSHRLSSVAGAELAHSMIGAIRDRGDGRTYEYDPRQRLSAAKSNGVVVQVNSYNAKGERLQKSTAAGVRRFAYNERGQLLSEQHDVSGSRQEYVWLYDRPVALLQHNGPYGSALMHFHTDHLGTPRALTDPGRSNVKVWTWTILGSAFGDHAPAQDPDGDLISVIVPLRYPGQYFDAESGLHYNHFRDYEPVIGRYIESDPIGLSAGMSTYSYVASNPVRGSDPLGLLTTLDAALVAHFFGGTGAFFMVDPAWCGRYKADSQIQIMLNGVKKKIDGMTRAMASSLAEGESAEFALAGNQDNYLDEATSFAFGKGNDKYDMRCTATKVNCKCATSVCSGGVGRIDWFTDPYDFYEIRGWTDSPFSMFANLGGTPFQFGINCDLSYATTKCI